MEPAHSPANGRQFADISTTSTERLEELVREKEARIATSLGSAQAKEDKAARLLTEAQILRRRQQEDEVIVHELQKLIKERIEQDVAQQAEADPARAPVKRSCSPDPNLNIAQKRVALTPTVQTADVAVKRKDSTAESLHSELGLLESNRSNSDDERSDGGVPIPQFQRLRKARAFQPPTKRAHPNEVFAQDMKTHPVHRPGKPTGQLRMLRRDDPDNEILVFTSGQFLNKSREIKEASAGCAVIYMPKSDGSGKWSDCIGFRLEGAGPNDDFFNPTSKRADLRAVVAALEFKLWSSEGWKKVTIATDSSYVVENITRHIVKWETEGWLGGKTHRNKKVQNLDLWTRALDLINEQEKNGCQVFFWQVKPEQNKQAHVVAKRMAKEGEKSESYRAFGDVGGDL